MMNYDNLKLQILAILEKCSVNSQYDLKTELDSLLETDVKRRNIRHALTQLLNENESAYEYYTNYYINMILKAKSPDELKMHREKLILIYEEMKENRDLRVEKINWPVKQYLEKQLQIMKPSGR